MAWRANNAPRYSMGVTNMGSSNTGLEFGTHDNGSQRMPDPFVQNKTKSLKFGATNDGKWHKYTLHIVTGAGGYEQIWVDDTLILDSNGLGYDHPATGIAMVQFPGLVVTYTGCTNFTIDADDLVIWHR